MSFVIKIFEIIVHARETVNLSGSLHPFSPVYLCLTVVSVALVLILKTSAKTLFIGYFRDIHFGYTMNIVSLVILHTVTCPTSRWGLLVSPKL